MADPLTSEQVSTLRTWVAQGLSLSDLQKRLAAELGLSLTYMEVRFLLDDHNLALREKTPPPTPPVPTEKVPPPAKPTKEPKRGLLAKLTGAGAEDEEPEPAGVRVEVDRVNRPGAMVSGQVTFSDGVSAQWFVDEMGRLGLNPSRKGYQPSREDILAFQQELDRALQGGGF